MSSHINLDSNASAGISDGVARALAARGMDLLNPSSIHQGGQESRCLIEEAREEVRLLLGCSRDFKVIFTSGATEANNTALQSVLWSTFTKKEPLHAVSSEVEHPSVLAPLERIRSIGGSITLVRPTRDGEITADAIVEALRPDTRFVSVMVANNETGHIYPVTEIAAAIRKTHPDILIHTDAVQGVGKLPLNIKELGVDLLSISGHKIGALTGIGALIVRESVKLHPLLLGGAQEGHLRAGTENVLGIVSLGIACSNIRATLDQRIPIMRERCQRIRSTISNELSMAKFHSPTTGGLPNTLNVTFPGVLADDLVVALDLEGILISSGAACASGKPDPSHVLLALGLSPEDARSSIRISVGPNLTDSEIERASETIVRLVRRMMEGRRAA